MPLRNISTIVADEYGAGSTDKGGGREKRRWINYKG